jgi:hypothetical protein
MGRAFRAIAVLIAVAGFVDPVFTWARSERPVLAVIDTDAPALTGDVSRLLSRDFTVHAGAMAGAAGTIVVGRALPVDPVDVHGALMAVTPEPAGATVSIEQVSVPAVATAASRIPVTVVARATGASGRTLRGDVSSGPILLDRVTHVVHSDADQFNVTLSATALAAGAMPLTVRVGDAAGADSALMAEAAAATEVVHARWKLLIVDPRPSWASTFVRRALEDDRRFDVASRVSTSRTVEMESGAAPLLSDARALEDVSAIVVGAPDALSAADVSALEAFARRRGGAVVFLMDRTDAGPFMRLTGATSWRDVHGVERRAVTGSSATMVATELAVPVGLPPAAEVLASAGSGATSMPAVWETPLGAGRLVVSGALDAWRYRARNQGGFTKFWTDVMSQVAAAAPPPVSVLPASRLVEPGGALDVRVIVRRAELSEPSEPAPAIEAQLRLEWPDASTAPETLRLWPTSERGVFVASIRAPRAPGVYRFVAEIANASSAAAEFIVGTGALRSADLGLWTAAHGGDVVPESKLAELTARAQARIAAPARPVQVRPMRSVWWLPLFVAVLGGEWWLRRRRGER